PAVSPVGPWPVPQPAADARPSSMTRVRPSSRLSPQSRPKGSWPSAHRPGGANPKRKEPEVRSVPDPVANSHLFGTMKAATATECEPLVIPQPLDGRGSFPRQASPADPKTRSQDICVGGIRLKVGDPHRLGGMARGGALQGTHGLVAN